MVRSSQTAGKKFFWPVKLSVDTALADYWNMPFGTRYPALRLKATLVLFHTWFKQAQKSGQKKNKRKTDEPGRVTITAYQPKNPTSCQKITAMTPNWVLFLTVIGWILNNRLYPQLVEKIDILKAILFTHTPSFLSVSISRDLSWHPVMNRFEFPGPQWRWLADNLLWTSRWSTLPFNLHLNN